MKTRKFTKLAAVMLAIALVFGAVVGINVSAADGADEGAATITNKNVDHGVELALCFAVEEGTAEGTLYVLVWNAGYEGEYTFDTADQQKTAIKDFDIDGDPRKLFIADSIALKDIDAPITFRTCIDKGDGTYVYGAVESYSIIDYANQRLTEIPGEDFDDAEKAVQTEICNTIIELNKAAEAVLGEGAEPND